jgi:N-carbamoylputrescine amidase
MPNGMGAFIEAWGALCRHVGENDSEFLLLPEMPFFEWMMAEPEVEPALWLEAVEAHDKWFKRLPELDVPVVASTRPSLRKDDRENVGFVWDVDAGMTDVHSKYYLPDEPGFWEATWYSRGEKEFRGIEVGNAKVGFLICTELWFTQHAREYGKQGVQLLLSPRATSGPSWIIGGQAAAIMSGAYSLSSNFSLDPSGKRPFKGMGWIIEPEQGRVLGTTSPEQPFLTLDIDLDIADSAKKSYPRYVRD